MLFQSGWKPCCSSLATKSRQRSRSCTTHDATLCVVFFVDRRVTHVGISTPWAGFLFLSRPEPYTSIPVNEAFTFRLCSRSNILVSRPCLRSTTQLCTNFQVTGVIQLLDGCPSLWWCFNWCLQLLKTCFHLYGGDESQAGGQTMCLNSNKNCDFCKSLWWERGPKVVSVSNQVINCIGICSLQCKVVWWLSSQGWTTHGFWRCPEASSSKLDPRRP